MRLASEAAFRHLSVPGRRPARWLPAAELGGARAELARDWHETIGRTSFAGGEPESGCPVESTDNDHIRACEGPMTKWTALAVAALSAIAMAGPARAQSSEPQSSGRPTWNGLPDRFQADVGYFRINLTTTLQLKGSVGPSTEVSFEKDVGLTDTAGTYWLDTTLRLSRRHSVKFGYLSVTRQGEPHSLSRDFEWDGKLYTAGLTTTGMVGMDVLSTYYRLAVVKRDRFDVGLSSGLGYLKLRASINAQGSLTGPGGVIQSVNLDGGGEVGTITGAIGGFFNAWLSKRVVMRGDFMYIMVKPSDREASVTDGRIAVDFYPLSHVGVGTQYKYNQFHYQQSSEDRSLGGTIQYQGIQVYASFLF
jgi:hypothetical protein